ncbi:MULTISPECIES: hypothetical protein [unclassified Frankia]|nr:MULTISPECIES: hypothetical protein [unclassified Frankia]
MDGLELTWRYQPGTVGTEAGGDSFDDDVTLLLARTNPCSHGS